MTTVSVSPAPERANDGRRALWTVSRYEALRLVRHPVFAVAMLFYLYGAVTTQFTGYANADYSAPVHGTESNLDWPMMPAFLLGLGGLIAMNRITSSAGRSGEVLHAAPMSEPRRSLALCIACLVPATLTLLGAIYVYVVWMVDPPVHTENWGEFSNAELAAVMACGVLAALGGSLLGVVTARWWRWPTAAAVTAVLLTMWTFVGLINDTHPLLTSTTWPRRSRWSRRTATTGRGTSVAAGCGGCPTSPGCARWQRSPPARTGATGNFAADRCTGRSPSASSPWPRC